METGDIPTTDEFLARIHLIVHEKRFESYRSATDEGFPFEHYDPATNKLLWRIPAGVESQICFEVPLRSGEHVATFIYDFPSGKEERFSWEFTLVPTDSLYVTPDVVYFHQLE
jgi:hypothetical protein